jgi:hypothetical protein
MQKQNNQVLCAKSTSEVAKETKKTQNIIS